MRQYTEFLPTTDNESIRRAEEFLTLMQRRRTVRHFSDQQIPDCVVNNCLQVALSAPSGANQQPWTFVVVKDVQIRKQIREAAEEEERRFYEHRAPEEWLNALRPLGTDASKPFLETAPILIAVFARSWTPSEGTRSKHYYVSESVGIACGFLIAALHNCGLAALTHTPSPMKFLNHILERPDFERPYLLLAAGRPAAGCEVPDIAKRPFGDSVFYC
ncbi:MAG: nitroreductase family protein [Planctomycetaceae bacterium]|nr:nitroreductase family protein [Planctomycetaceae bacterium]